MEETKQKITDKPEDVILKVENINELIMDATARGDNYRVVYSRFDDLYFEQTVEGEGVCEYCGEELEDCTCLKEKAIIQENILINYINNLFATEDDILLIVNGNKFKRIS